MDADHVIDDIGRVFAKYEIPIGLMNKLYNLTEVFTLLSLHIPAYTHTHTCTHAHTNTNTNTHKHTHTHTHAHKHKHTHTHTHTLIYTHTRTVRVP